MYYKRWTAEINPKGLYYVRKTYIMESEKRWVTIDGRHVDIGGDGDSGSGGGSSGGGSSNGGAGKKKISIENVTGETAVIDKRKFTEYALNPEKQPDKAKAFKDALGYDLSNYSQLEAQIREEFDREKLKYKTDSGYGKKYEQQMKLKGVNGKSAKVMTGWIDDVVKNDFHLTSVYVDK